MHGGRIEHYRECEGRTRTEDDRLQTMVSHHRRTGNHRVFAAARDITSVRRRKRRSGSASAYNRSLIEASLGPAGDHRARRQDHRRQQGDREGDRRIRARSSIGTDFSDYFTDPEKAREGYQQVFRRGLGHGLSAGRSGTATGTITPVLYNASVYRDANGQGARRVRRGARHHRAQEGGGALRLASAYNRSLIEASLDPLVTIGPDGKITDVNEATEQGDRRSRARS